MRDAQEVLEACDRLARISALPDGIKRIYLSPEHAKANALVMEWVQAQGFDAWQDPAGNLCARMEGAQSGLPALLLGSHLDTVPYAGRYDGILGVMIGLAVMIRLKQKATSLPFALELIGFADEEGTRFGVTLLGSFALAGHWNPEWWDIQDADGISIRQAFEAFGLDPDAITQAARSAESVVGYLEAHIEQGPVLEAEDHALGVVTAIAGASRFDVHVKGKAGHAGTTPFNLRHDALCSASEMVLAVERIARENNCVATVGQLEVEPGAVNVVPGNVRFSIDLRSEDDKQRDQCWKWLNAELNHIAGLRKVDIQIRQTHSAAAQVCSLRLRRFIDAGIIASGDDEPRHLFSGAGHDAMAVGSLTEVAMLFIRCAGGLSHHPDESVEEDDVAKAIDAMEAAVLALANDYAKSWPIRK